MFARGLDVAGREAMRLKAILLAVSLAGIVSVGCAPESDKIGDDPSRGAIGKADVFGSCTPATCGHKSTDGNCWCDDLCTGYLDCCDNKVDVCGGVGNPDECGEVLCDLFCENGFAQDEDGCDICECIEEPECEPVLCEMLCINGFQQDEDGCEICVCKGAFCGGFGNLPCPSVGDDCVDDPWDDCDPNIGADCGGMCVPKQCGGFANFPCPGGAGCIDDPSDDCDPDNGGADCSGICVDCPDLSGYCEAACNGDPLPNIPNGCPIPGCACPEPVGNSCEDQCGGQSADQTCWCDDYCTYYGDCCDDFADHCE